MKKRLIGLAVILFAVFLLTFLLPRRPPAGAPETSIPVTAVAVSGTSAAAAPMSPAPPSTAATTVPAMGPVSTPPIQPPAAPVPVSTWYVQIGSYSQRAGAERVLQRLQRLRLTGEVQAAEVNGKTFYRVRLGPYADAAEAARAQRQARDAGFASAQLISP